MHFALLAEGIKDLPLCKNRSNCLHTCYTKTCVVLRLQLRQLLVVVESSLLLTSSLLVFLFTATFTNFSQAYLALSEINSYKNSPPKYDTGYVNILMTEWDILYSRDQTLQLVFFSVRAKGRLQFKSGHCSRVVFVNSALRFMFFSTHSNAVSKLLFFFFSLKFSSSNHPQ